jgi:rare lipoprotein A
MRRAILLFLLVLSAAGYGQAKGKDKTVRSESERSAAKQPTTDKTTAVDKSKQATAEKAKITVPDPSVSEQAKQNLKSLTDKLKPSAAKDTVKATVAVEPEIIFNDSVIAVKGKFRPYKKNVHASYYHNKFNGKRTASGKKFSNKGYTAAHRKLPFGTILRITNEENGKSVIVEVIDRGPFSRGREIDLTNRAFMEIASNKNSGSMNVKIEIMD